MKLTDQQIRDGFRNDKTATCILTFGLGARFAESRLLPMIDREWRKYDPKDDATWPKDEQMIIGHYRDHGLLAVKFFAVNGSVTGLLFWQPAPEPPKIDHEREQFERIFASLHPNRDSAFKEDCWLLWKEFGQSSARKETK